MRQEDQQLEAQRAALKLGGVSVIVGSLAVFGFRLAHGDPPAADSEAHLRFITDHPAYAGVHLGAIVGVLAWLGGLVAISSTLLGAAIFIVDYSIDGIAGQDLAKAWAAATPAARADLVLAAHTASTMLRGMSLTAIVILWGIPLLLFGRAVTVEGYPAWLGWTGLMVGTATALGATALLLQPDLFPGVLVYGLMASVVVQLWSLILGVQMWRRAGAASR